MRPVRWPVVIAALLTSACPATMQVALRNDSPEEIEVLSAYSDAVLARIAASSSEDVPFGQDCFRVRAGGQVLEFQPAIPPDAYIEVGLFRTRISATFTRSNEVQITPAEAHPSTDAGIGLKRGCPVEPGAKR